MEPEIIRGPLLSSILGCDEHNLREGESFLAVDTKYGTAISLISRQRMSLHVARSSILVCM